MIGTEILELCAVLEHVVDRREEGGSDGADGLFGPTSAGETVVLGVEVALMSVVNWAAQQTPFPCRASGRGSCFEFGAQGQR